MPLVNSTQLNNYTPTKQRETREKNLDKIILVLSDGPNHFNTIMDLTDISHTTLSSCLHKLMDDGLVTKTIHENSEAYKLTEKGESEYHKIILLIDVLTEIRAKDGRYLTGGAPLFPNKEEPITWPSVMHLAADKDIPNIVQIIPKDYVFELQMNILNALTNNIKKKNLPLNEKIQGNIVLALEIDYQDLVRSIKGNAFEEWKKLWNKEKEINVLWHLDSLNDKQRLYITKHKLKGEYK